MRILGLLNKNWQLFTYSFIYVLENRKVHENIKPGNF